MSEQFALFCEELLRWNATHSLTGYKTRTQIFQNIRDSIYPLDNIADFRDALDIGSGCGFPAIPLAISRPQARFTLLEPNAKKRAFLHIIALKLALKNVEILAHKIENLQSGEFDLIVSRATFKTRDLVAMSGKFLREDGHFLFYKSISEAKGADSTNYIKNAKIAYFYATKQAAESEK